MLTRMLPFSSAQRLPQEAGIPQALACTDPASDHTR